MKSIVIFRTITIFHTIKTFQVRTCLCICDRIISRDCIFYKSQIKCLNNRTLFFEYFCCLHHSIIYFRIQTFSHIISWDSNTESFHIIDKCFCEITIITIHGSAVLRIMGCNCFKNCRTIRYIFRYRSNLI